MTNKKLDKAEISPETREQETPTGTWMFLLPTSTRGNSEPIQHSKTHFDKLHRIMLFSEVFSNNIFRFYKRKNFKKERLTGYFGTCSLLTVSAPLKSNTQPLP